MRLQDLQLLQVAPEDLRQVEGLAGGQRHLGDSLARNGGVSTQQNRKYTMVSMVIYIYHVYIYNMVSAVNYMCINIICIYIYVYVIGISIIYGI